MQNLIFGPALFYDIPEYLSIVSNHSFWQVFSLGHFPIHPVFLGILWILIKFLPVNLIAMVFGITSIAILYKISKIVFKKGWLILPVLIFALFPGIFLVNTNLMVESATLTFYLLSIYFFLLKKPNGFGLALFLMIGTHLEAIFWIPAIFLLPFIFHKEIKLNRKEITIFIKYTALSLLISVIFYLLLYTISGRQITGAGEQLVTYLSSGLLRMVRNAWLTFAAGFGSLTLLLLIFLLIKKVGSKKEATAWLIFFIVTSLIAANWQGDFMPRRIVFAGVTMALGLYKYLGRKSVLVVLYLVPIVIANLLLYANGSPFTKFQIPEDQVLIQTFYLKPFSVYNGRILWTSEIYENAIDRYLNSGKRVFITKDAVTAPYRVLVGNNFHITSLGRVGNSESRFLFTKYVVDQYGNSFELKLPGKINISASAGDPVIFYDNSFWGRLTRRRVDYGDFGVWAWAFLTNYRDSAGWTYRDVRGIWYNM